MVDNAGIIWKIDVNDLVRYEKTRSGGIIEHSRLEQFTLLEGNMKPRLHPLCGGTIYGPRGLRICAKCSADIKREN